MKKSHATKLWVLQIFYASCYIALVVSLIVQVSQCIKKFTDGSTYYDSSVVRQKKTLFPDITVCGNMFGLKEAKLKVKIFFPNCSLDYHLSFVSITLKLILVAGTWHNFLQIPKIKQTNPLDKQTPKYFSTRSLE